MSKPSSILGYAALVLRTASAHEKSALTLEAWRRHECGEISVRPDPGQPQPTAPDAPARPDDVETVLPQHAPARGKGGSLAKRVAMVHSLAHIESWAIDLSHDILLRFAGEVPDEFVLDWFKVAEDEARHFAMWAGRLVEMGSEYGALPAHDGLWQSAGDTRDSLMARLAIVHMVHEARGLDVAPKTLARFRSAPDARSADLLDEIFRDEVTHVERGVRWFRHFADERGEDPVPFFHAVVRERFYGLLKPPFNDRARADAGFTPEWYLPLTKRAE